MRSIDQVNKADLPGSCPRSLTGRGCGIGFAGDDNLWQDTDGCVYCANCGLNFGAWPAGRIKFKVRDDNIIP